MSTSQRKAPMSTSQGKVGDRSLGLFSKKQPAYDEVLERASRDLDAHQTKDEGLQMRAQNVFRTAMTLPGTVAVDRLMDWILNRAAVGSHQWTPSSVCLEIARFVKDEVIGYEALFAGLMGAIEETAEVRDLAMEDPFTRDWIKEFKKRKRYSTTWKKMAALYGIRQDWGMEWYVDFGWTKEIEDRGENFLVALRGLARVGKEVGWGLRLCATTVHNWSNYRQDDYEINHRSTIKWFAEGIVTDDVVNAKKYVEQMSANAKLGAPDTWVVYRESMRQAKAQALAAKEGKTTSVQPRMLSKEEMYYGLYSPPGIQGSPWRPPPSPPRLPSPAHQSPRPPELDSLVDITQSANGRTSDTSHLMATGPRPTRTTAEAAHAQKVAGENQIRTNGEQQDAAESAGGAVAATNDHHDAGTASSVASLPNNDQAATLSHAGHGQDLGSAMGGEDDLSRQNDQGEDTSGTGEKNAEVGNSSTGANVTSEQNNNLSSDLSQNTEQPGRIADAQTTPRKQAEGLAGMTNGAQQSRDGSTMATPPAQAPGATSSAAENASTDPTGALDNEDSPPQQTGREGAAAMSGEGSAQDGAGGPRVNVSNDTDDMTQPGSSRRQEPYPSTGEEGLLGDAQPDPDSDHDHQPRNPMPPAQPSPQNESPAKKKKKKKPKKSGRGSGSATQSRAKEKAAPRVQDQDVSSESDEHPDDLISSAAFKKSKKAYGYLPDGTFEEDSAGQILRKRVVETQVLLDNQGRTKMRRIILPPFDGSDAVRAFLQAALINNHIPSEQVEFVDGATIAVDDFNRLIAKGKTTFVIRNCKDPETMIESLKRHHVKTNVESLFHDMAHEPEHLHTGKHNDPVCRKRWDEILAAWKEALPTARARQARKSVNCLSMEGKWVACEKCELFYRKEMDDIRKRRDVPCQTPLDEYVEAIKKTFPEDIEAPSDIVASVNRQCIEFAEWAIAATAGSISHRHRDAAGSFTYLIVHSGKKLWIMRKGPHVAPEKNDVVELSAGDVIIMIPGVEHFVYTIEPSFCTGGHFYLMKHLGATLKAKKDDWRAPWNVGTNQCLGISYAYMVWYGIELLSPDEELTSRYRLTKNEIATLRQAIRNFLAMKVVKGIAPFRAKEEKPDVAAVLAYMTEKAAHLAERLEEMGVHVTANKKQSKKRKRGEVDSDEDADLEESDEGN